MGRVTACGGPDMVFAPVSLDGRNERVENNDPLKTTFIFKCFVTVTVVVEFRIRVKTTFLM